MCSRQLVASDTLQPAAREPSVRLRWLQTCVSSGLACPGGTDAWWKNSARIASERASGAAKGVVSIRSRDPQPTAIAAGVRAGLAGWERPSGEEMDPSRHLPPKTGQGAKLASATPHFTARASSSEADVPDVCLNGVRCSCARRQQVFACHRRNDVVERGSCRERCRVVRQPLSTRHPACGHHSLPGCFASRRALSLRRVLQPAPACRRSLRRSLRAGSLLASLNGSLARPQA